MKNFYITAVMLVAVICNGLSAAPQAAGKAEKTGELTVFSSKDSPFLFGKYTFKDKPESCSGSELALKQLKISARGKKGKDVTFSPLYPVFYVSGPAGETQESLFMLPVASLKQLEKHKAKLLFSVNNAAYLNMNFFYAPSIDSAVTAEFVADENKFAAIKSQWETGIKHKLSTDLQNYEDTEMEVLLYMRLFNKVPDVTQKNWKNDELSRFIFSVSGLHDIRDAIPLSQDNKPVMEAQTELPPQAVTLPQVTVEKSIEADDLSRWVPRSCYYASWRNIADMKKTLFGFADLFDTWSKGTYPLSGRQILQKYLDQTGILDGKYFSSNLEDNVESVALSGWDPYFQSGTSILFVIKTKRPAAALPASPYVSSPEKNIIVLSNSEKLYNMALDAYKSQRSLAQENNYAYSRQRIKAGKGENELAFVYLSDYWLANFISPRWKILNDRLARVDARIRLVYLLKICRMYECGKKTLPALDELKDDPLMSEEFKTWLFAGLEEKDGVVRDCELGGLFDHPAIDTLNFDKVTKSEFKQYENFKRVYSQRWQQIDPIAFQLAEDKNGTYKTRLYISPIGNRSDFRQIRGFVSPEKSCHAFENIPGRALSLSVAIPSTPLKAYGIQADLPLLIFVQLVAFDFAPSSYSPASWLEEPRKYDAMSYMRIPAALALPGVASNAVSLMMGRVDFGPSAYKDIEVMRQSQFAKLFPTMRLNRSGDGIQYFGVDPSTLIRIRDNATGKFERDTVPCDIRLSADFVQGYQLKRKLMFEALKNRALSSWRRQNRIYRIKQFFSQNKEDQAWLAMLKKNHVFPTGNMVADESLIGRIPPVKNLPPPKYSYGSSVIEGAGKLPELMRDLDKIDVFISVEPNAVMFESHFKFATPPEQKSASPSQVQVTNPGFDRKPSKLDFDK